MAWENLLPQAGQVKMNSLSDYSWPMPAQNEMALLGAADMLDQRQARQIQNRIAKLQYETSEAHVQGQKELSQYASAERTGQNDVFTSQGYVPADRYMTWATRYPQEAASERQQQTDNALAIATERRKAAETLMNSFVKAGYNPTEINGQVAALYPDVAASLTMPNRQADTQPTNALATPVARPGMFVDPGQIGKTANAFLQGGNALTPNAPPGVPPTQPPSASISPGMTPGQGGQPNAPVQAPQPAVAAPTPQPAPQPAQSVPANSRQAFLDKVNEAQTNPDTQKGLEMLGAIRPSNNWEMNELKAARMFLATKASASKEPNATEANYRLGLEDQLKQQHPDWSPKKIQFEAAKQIRKENADAAKQKLTIQIMEREAAKRKGEAAPMNPENQHTVDVMTAAINEGRMAPSQLNTAIQRLGGGHDSAKIRSAIVTNVLEGGIDLEAAENNYKAKSSTLAITRIQLAKTTVPIAEEVKKLADKLPDDWGFVPANEFARKASRLFNNEEIIKFEFDKNKMVEEFERMLTGSQMADTRVQRNLELVRTGYSKKAIRALADEVIKISNTSTTAVTSPMYEIKPGQRSPASASGNAADLSKFWK